LATGAGRNFEIGHYPLHLANDYREIVLIGLICVLLRQPILYASPKVELFPAGFGLDDGESTRGQRQKRVLAILRLGGLWKLDLIAKVMIRARAAR
jgi:hypothetical protein